jgi:hypothetical protein
MGGKQGVLRVPGVKSKTALREKMLASEQRSVGH